MGTSLAEIIPLKVISAVAGLSFLLFGLLALRGEEGGGVVGKAAHLGPFLTIVLTSAAAEMGDKTQPATVALAASFREPLPVFLGATAGMVAAGSAGILVGDVLLRRRSPRRTRVLSAGIFMLFGFMTLFEALGTSPTSYATLGSFAIVMAVASCRLLRITQPEQSESVAGMRVPQGVTQGTQKGDRGSATGA